MGRNLVGGNLAIGASLGIVGNLNVGNSIGDAWNVGKLTEIDGSLGLDVNGLEQEEDKLLLGLCSRRCGVVDIYYFDPLTKCPV